MARRSELAAAGVLVTLAAVTFWESTRWPPAASFAGNPTLLPRTLGLLLIATAIALVALPAPGPRADGEDQGPPRLHKTLAAIGATAGLAAMLPLLGVIGTGIPYLVALQRMSGAAWIPSLATSIAAPVAVWLAFAKGLNVPLPTGSLWTALGG